MFPAELLSALPVDQPEEVWRAQLEALPERATALVAEEDGAVLGYASCGPSRDDEATGEIYAIYVLPVEWGRGAGAKLMAAGLEALRSAGFGEATLWVLEGNPRARGFYERGGWRLDGATRTHNMLGVEAVEVRYRVSLIE